MNDGLPEWFANPQKMDQNMLLAFSKLADQSLKITQEDLRNEYLKNFDGTDLLFTESISKLKSRSNEEFTLVFEMFNGKLAIWKPETGDLEIHSHVSRTKCNTEF